MTKIPWTDQTYNPIIGCSKISDGCKNCYAETMAARLSVMLGRIGTGGQTDAWSAYSSVVTDRRWNGSTALIASALSKPLLRNQRQVGQVARELASGVSEMIDDLHNTII